MTVRHCNFQQACMVPCSLLQAIQTNNAQAAMASAVRAAPNTASWAGRFDWRISTPIRLEGGENSWEREAGSFRIGLQVASNLVGISIYQLQSVETYLTKGGDLIWGTSSLYITRLMDNIWLTRWFAEKNTGEFIHLSILSMNRPDSLTVNCNLFPEGPIG